MQAFRQITEALLFRHPARTFDLVGVVVDADDVGAREARDFAERPADAASEIDRAHARPQPEDVRKVVFVPRQGCRKALAGTPRREVKGATPTVFVEVRGEVVVGVAEGDVVVLAAVESTAPLGAVAPLELRGATLDILDRVVAQELGNVRGHGAWLQLGMRHGIERRGSGTIRCQGLRTSRLKRRSRYTAHRRPRRQGKPQDATGT